LLQKDSLAREQIAKSTLSKGSVTEFNKVIYVKDMEMNSVYEETEVKIYVQNLDEIRQKLESLEAECIQERIHERNTRYDLSNGSLTARGVVLRLREDNGVILTYKEPGVIERGIISREELELEVSDFAIMEAILGKFGYQAAMFYEKYRTVYALDGVEIMLDELPFGHFVEIEGDNARIESVMKKLGLADIKRVADSYSKLFDYVKHHLELNFRDLTFENFADVEVQESDFIPPGSIVIG
jgi:adenylate cyclase class 2